MINVAVFDKRVSIYDTSIQESAITTKNVENVDVIVNKYPMYTGDELTTGRIYVYSKDLIHPNKIFLGVDNQATLIGIVGDNFWSNSSIEELNELITAHYNGDITLKFRVGEKRRVHLSAIPADTNNTARVPEQDIDLVVLHSGGFTLENGQDCIAAIGQEKVLNSGETNGNLNVIYTSMFNDKNTDFQESVYNYGKVSYRQLSDGKLYFCDTSRFYIATYNLLDWLNSSYYGAYPLEIKNLFKRFKSYSAHQYFNLNYRRTKSYSGITFDEYSLYNIYSDKDIISRYTYFDLPSVKQILGGSSIEFPVSLNGNDKTAMSIFDEVKSSNMHKMVSQFDPNMYASEFQMDYYKSLTNKGYPCSGSNQQNNSCYLTSDVFSWIGTIDSTNCWLCMYSNVTNATSKRPYPIFLGGNMAINNNGVVEHKSLSNNYSGGILPFGCI